MNSSEQMVCIGPNSVAHSRLGSAHKADCHVAL